jgi:hypothetical protein
MASPEHSKVALKAVKVINASGQPYRDLVSRQVHMEDSIMRLAQKKRPAADSISEKKRGLTLSLIRCADATGPVTAAAIKVLAGKFEGSLPEPRALAALETMSQFLKDALEKVPADVFFARRCLICLLRIQP